jgi:hypothetical protein
VAKIKTPKPKVIIEQNNFSVIKKYGGTVASQVKQFSRIRSFNSKDSAITLDGDLVERREVFFVEGYGMVKQLPTTMHFIYEDNSKKIGRWVHMCTCGSIAGVIAYDELKDFITTEPVGYLMACIAGVASKQNVGIFTHADGSTE